MKLNSLLYSLLFFLFYGSQAIYAQKAESEPNHLTDIVYLLDYKADYLWTNDTVSGTSRMVNLSDYDNDTLRAYYSADWHVCLPALAKYFTYAVKQGEFWHCSDYYTENGEMFRTGFFEDKELTKPVGPFRCYYKDGQLAKYGVFKEGKRNGKWQEYFSDGRLCYETVYKDNYQTGFSISVNINNDSTLYYLNDLGEGCVMLHYASGKKVYQGKYAPHGVKDSLWCFYDNKERIWYTQTYENGVLVSETCYDTTGLVMQDCVSQEAVFRKGKNSLQRYMYNALTFPKGYELTKGPQRIVASFMVEKDGKISDIRLIQSLHPAFDKAVIDALGRMPRWKSPRIDHNRRVKSYFVVPFTFSYQHY